MQPGARHQFHGKKRQKGEAHEQNRIFEGAGDELVEIDRLIKPHAKLRLRNPGEVACIGEHLTEAAREVRYVPGRVEAAAVDLPFGWEKTAEETGIRPSGLNLHHVILTSRYEHQLRGAAKSKSGLQREPVRSGRQPERSVDGGELHVCCIGSGSGREGNAHPIHEQSGVLLQAAHIRKPNDRNSFGPQYCSAGRRRSCDVRCFESGGDRNVRGVDRHVIDATRASLRPHPRGLDARGRFARAPLAFCHCKGDHEERKAHEDCQADNQEEFESGRAAVAPRGLLAWTVHGLPRRRTGGKLAGNSGGIWARFRWKDAVLMAAHDAP